MQSVKTHTPLPLVALADEELAHRKARLPVAMDGLAVAQGRWNRNKYRSGNPLDRFFDKIVIHKPTDCWIWLSRRNKSGYGQFSLNGRKVGAHRAALLLIDGIDAGSELVCHKCDIAPCVNPDHLFVGSAQDNIDDCVAKDRRKYQYGSKKYNAKLHEQDVVVAWILRHAFGFSVMNIAILFSVDKNTIANIFYSKTHWRLVQEHLTGTDGWHMLNHPWPA